MKTAVSIPDEVFAAAERLADQLGWSRSQLYSKALADFLASESESDPVTAALDRLADEQDTQAVRDSGRDLIESGLWEW
jgi:hypothetical protein